MQHGVGHDKPNVGGSSICSQPEKFGSAYTEQRDS